MNQERNTILIVDDNPANLRVLFEYLRSAGFKVLVATNASNALEGIKHHPPDIILLDVMMPEVDGFETCRRLKATETASNIPVIFMTALSDTIDKLKGFELGAVDYIIKPIQVEEVAARINTHITIRNLQKKLLEKNLELQREIEDRLRTEQALMESQHQCNIARESAEKSNAAKSQFLANMSHELRTPMNAILGFSEILLGEIENPRHEEYLKSIYTSGKSLLALINDILDLSKIEAGKMSIQPEPLSIHALLNELITIFSPKSKEKGVELKIDVPQDFPRRLILDEVRLRQILTNLMSNALKFTDQGYVSLIVKQHPPSNQGNFRKINAVIEVADTGIGIPQDQQELIFESFHQQEGQKVKQYGGTGLGLAITRRLTEMMNGSITVESQAGKGSLFRVTFYDVQTADEMPEPDECLVWEHRDIRFEPGTILLVDDVESNRNIIKGYLKKHRISVIEAENGEHALSLLRNRDFWIEKTGGAFPDLILMDLRMPGRDGYEVTVEIKADMELKTIPIIACTAVAMKTDEEGIQGIFDGYLKKPISGYELIQVLKKHFSYQTETASPRTLDGKLCIPGIQRTSLSEILDVLEGRIIPKWEALQEVYFIDEVEEFAAELREIVRRYNLYFLEEYSERLHACAQANQIDEMEKLMGEFKTRIQSLTRQLVEHLR